jgi:hypothetical protein
MTVYVSPNGSGTGLQGDPASLTTGLTMLPPGGTLVLNDGVYTVASGLSIQNYTTPTTIQAASGARPILTTSDSKCPAITFGNNLHVTGLWFGGLRDENQLTELHVGTDVTLQDCVLFNYVEGIGEGTGTRNTYQRNKFISCGQGTLSHSLYINNAISHTATVTDNIFIGGAAYHIHLFHDPTDTDVTYNFSGDADYCLVPNGSGHNVDHNIFWKPSSPGYPVNLSTGSSRTYTKNYHGPIASGSERNGHLDWFGAAIPVDMTASGNYYYANTLEPGYDPNSPTTTNDGDEVTLLNKSAAQIDAAISALELAFAQTVQQIHDDATIETHFATLKNVIDTWKLQ